MEFNGRIISAAATKSKGIHEGDVLQAGFNKYIDCTKPCVYVNHSCNPNTGVKDDRELFAIKNIKADEQITFDYSTVMDEDDWEMDCKCGSRNCRKRIRDFKYLPKSLQKNT
ncbi:MAG: SET domain-containing protein-lysine N-methyltransferase [Candidatus Aenigmarchaeota archaeon]|nr:SET domain-containing protein-lysine N-methyltransferase [Candidatus Aenigmarchaeota archaeon]